MSGERTQGEAERRQQPVPAHPLLGATADQENDRVGPYGGDDGALEHEREEIEQPDTLTPEDTGSKVEPGRKGAR